MGFFKLLRLFGIGQQVFKSERFSAVKTTARRKAEMQPKNSKCWILPNQSLPLIEQFINNHSRRTMLYHVAESAKNDLGLLF